MEDPQAPDFDQSEEEISESFLCCVCLDLLYKPVVLSCGHVSCFWCVHESMNSVNMSHCPICRQSYNHFPTVCQMLQVVLVKLYPVSYKRREEQTLEYEKGLGIYSPQFDNLPYEFHPKQERTNLTDPALSCMSGEPDMCSHSGNNTNCTPRAKLDQSESSSMIPENDTTTFSQTHNSNVEVTEVSQLKEATCTGDNPDRNNKKVSLDDVLCPTCNQMLFRPLVFNCGHVVCETCIVIPAEEKLMCRICLTPHPTGPPKVCLALDHFLEKEFPQEYAARRSTLQLQPARVQLQHQSASTNGSETVADPSLTPAGANLMLQVHIGVGCDWCGRVPIVGNRYKCKDCVERIGFDLCNECYNTRSKLPGRFNQQHTEEHQFELIVRARNMAIRLVTGPPGDDATDASVSSSVIWINRTPMEIDNVTYILRGSDSDVDSENDTRDDIL